MNQYDPNNLIHYCGGPVKTTDFQGDWSAVCEGCGKTISDCKTSEELVVKWYGMKPEKEIGKDIEKALQKLVSYLSRHEEEIYSRKLLAIAGEGGRRALDILDNSGLIKSRFQTEDNYEASVEQAMEAKKGGKEVKAFCRRNFNLVEKP